MGQDIFTEYEKFLKKREYKKAYHCLEEILDIFPDDVMFLEKIIELCIDYWDRPEKAKKWLRKIVNLRSFWVDYFLLSRLEIDAGNILKGRKYLKKAKELLKVQEKDFKKYTRKRAEDMIEHLDAYIKFKENEKLKGETDAKTYSSPPVQIIPQKDKPEKIEVPTPTVAEKLSIPTYKIPINIAPFDENIFTPLFNTIPSKLSDTRILIDYLYLTMHKSYDELLCLSQLQGVEKYWYQIETAKRVLKYFHGRVLLCDEVGLGKTIEAGILLKEYLVRNMVKKVLILVPASLVSQWYDEMLSKFGLNFKTTNDQEFEKSPEDFWKNDLIISSLNVAKNKKNFPFVIEQFYDLVIVDEAHHLRNRTTLNWKLVNQIKKKFIFLLTATPIQNNLIELFNLITLLKPGQFKTEKLFKKEYIQKGNLKISEKEKLRELLRDVMIRNTRSVIDLKLPKRFATTIRVEPEENEKRVYRELNNFLKSAGINKMLVGILLREAGSSLYALRSGLLNMNIQGLKSIIDDLDIPPETAKAQSLLNLLLKNPEEKKIIFTQFIKTVDYIEELLTRYKIPCVTFKGSMTSSEKDSAITRFKEDIPVLISTEIGGEGRNIQFCNTIINFDLPWNPMKIEQRIGRLHRIGQKKDVFIFNLSVKETIEDYIIEILDSKINMFEMVIGEIEPILGYLDEEKEFEELIIELWMRSKDEADLKENFEKLGKDLITAKEQYLKTKTFDREIFGEDYEV